MSFFSGIRTENMPGPICGNPLHCLNEKICLQAKKVFDACLKREHIENQTVQLTNFNPESPTAPLTFVSGAASQTLSTTFSNVEINRLQDRPNFARVTVTANIPIDVVFEDSTGTQGTAQGYITLDESVILFVPQNSLIQTRIEPVASAVIPQATFSSDTTLLLDACVLLIIKVVAEVEVLVPSYGYCNIPPCQEANQDVCEGFFELPLFPLSQPTPILDN